MISANFSLTVITFFIKEPRSHSFGLFKLYRRIVLQEMYFYFFNTLIEFLDQLKMFFESTFNLLF